ncbi:hypothetical protein KR222_003724, partial [Zaprionus bogoriensis]
LFCSLKKYAVLWILLAVAAVCLILGLAFGLHTEPETRHIGAVASNGAGCAEIGGQMLDIGGSAADAVIATMLCEGVVLPNSVGAGGGFVATIYDKEMGRVETLIASETAPTAAAAMPEMFASNGTGMTGALAAATPSQIYGFWRLHEKYGKLPWRTLFEPTIELCRSGIVVSHDLADVLAIHEQRIHDESTMSEVFINPHTQRVYRAGELIRYPVLADTLEIIAVEGAQVVYRGGRVGRMLVEDIQQMGGIITEQDLQSYDVRWEEPLRAKFDNGHVLYTSPLPSSGAVLVFMLNVMASLYTSNRDVYWQRLVETFKHAHGQRSQLGDIHFEPSVREAYERLIDADFAAGIRQLIRDNATREDLQYYGANHSDAQDHGTAHISVLAPNGDAISVTGSLNRHLGAMVRSRQTGIILNDQMDDFVSLPANTANCLRPGKRPMASSCPSIVLDEKGDVQLVVGAAGGSRIPSAVAQTILRYFVLQEPIEEAVNAGRLHHQLAPMHLDVEPSVPRHTVHHLQRVGHRLRFLAEKEAQTAVTAVGYRDGEPHPVCDRRRVGSAVVVEPAIATDY